MQQIYLPKAVCRGVRVDVHAPPEAVERHRRIRLYERLRAGGCSEALALEAVGTPRSTLFRWRRSFQRLGLAGLSDRSRRPARARRPRWTPDVRFRPPPAAVRPRPAAAGDQPYHAAFPQPPPPHAIGGARHPERLRRREPPAHQVHALHDPQPPERLRVVRAIHPRLPVKRLVLCQHPHRSVSHVVCNS